LLSRQVLQITAVHAVMDSEIDARGKGVGNCVCFANYVAFLTQSSRSRSCERPASSLIKIDSASLRAAFA
jgi:hypothetical protein